MICFGDYTSPKMETSVPPVNFTNKIVTTNTTVTSYGGINVQNVNVRNNAKLTLDVAGAISTLPVILKFN